MSADNLLSALDQAVAEIRHRVESGAPPEAVMAAVQAAHERMVDVAVLYEGPE